MKELHLLIEGRVQHVGFRRYLLRQAERLKLTGWVRNNEDGSVETLAIGNEKNIIDFVNACHRGPLFAHVVNVSILSITEEDRNYVLSASFLVLRQI